MFESSDPLPAEFLPVSARQVASEAHVSEEFDDVVRSWLREAKHRASDDDTGLRGAA